MAGPSGVAVDLTALAAALDAPVLAEGPVACRGDGASPGIVHGVVGLDPTAVDGPDTILFLRESRPADLDGLLAAAAVVTELGGYTSHAAVVARGRGMPMITALDAVVDTNGTHVRCADGTVLRAGDRITVDGRAGTIHLGWDVVPSADNVEAIHELTSLLRDVGPLPVRVNADDPTSAARGLADGAVGIGLCRLEHFFLGDRRAVLATAMTSAPGPDRLWAAEQIRTIVRTEVGAMLDVADERPVVLRLLDPPRHEFLPDRLDEPAAMGDQAEWEETQAFIRRNAEHNPMLGLRGIRLAVAMPELAWAQVSGVVEAIALAERAGSQPHVELLLPMISDVCEVRWAAALLDRVLAADGGPRIRRPSLGAMVETPRAALLAADLANHVDFLAIGTNDLSALMWGLSRDDADRSVVPAYVHAGLWNESPLRSYDAIGVGSLVTDMVRRIRSTAPHVRIGVCGVHTDRPESAVDLLTSGVDYVSCAAPRVLLIRAAAASVAAQ